MKWDPFDAVGGFGSLTLPAAALLFLRNSAHSGPHAALAVVVSFMFNSYFNVLRNYFDIGDRDFLVYAAVLLFAGAGASYLAGMAYLAAYLAASIAVAVALRLSSGGILEHVLYGVIHATPALLSPTPQRLLLAAGLGVLMSNLSIRGAIKSMLGSEHGSKSGNVVHLSKAARLHALVYPASLVAGLWNPKILVFSGVSWLSLIASSIMHVEASFYLSSMAVFIHMFSVVIS